MEAFSRIGVEHSVARVADGLGQLLSALGRFREARAYLEISINIKARIGDLRGQSISFGSLSRAALRSGDMNSARRFADKVLNISSQLGDNRGHVAGMVYRADFRRRAGQGLLEKANMMPRTRGMPRLTWKPRVRRMHRGITDRLHRTDHVTGLAASD